MADAPPVSVVIPTHQRRGPLREALLSLAEQTAPSGSYEVIVSVDGSTDGTAEMLAEFDAPYPLRTAAGSARGRAGACNAGIALARGEIVIILDDDMRVVPEFVERHRRHHTRGSRLCVLGAVPVHLDEHSPLAARYVREKFDTHLSRLVREDHLSLPRSFYSGNASLRAEVLRDVGGFDESFGTYGNEDVELSLRLRAAGVKLRYDGEALARQTYGKDLRGLAQDTLAKGGTAVLLARAHPEAFGALRLAAPRDSTRPWLAARSVLLWLTRRWAGASAAVFAFAAGLERLGFWRQPLFYRAVLDYAFWTGVQAELSETDEGGLRELAVEMHRGPIGLLLHR